MRCPKCGKDWPESYKGCPECVVSLTVTASGERSVAIGGDATGNTFNFGDTIISPEAPPEDLLFAYYHALANECARLPLGVVDPKFATPGREGEVSLQQVYVDLDVVAPVREETEDTHAWGLRLARGEGDGRTPLLEALAAPAAARAVLLGDAGSGKTTFVNTLVYRLAAAASTEEAHTEDLPAPFQGLWPVRLLLRDVATHVPAEATCGTAAMLWNALRADMAARLNEAAAERLLPYVQARVLRRGGLFLLDGLDEVPEAGRRRKCLLEALQALVDSLPEAARVLLTARPYAYADPAWQLADFPILALAPFDAAQVERFVARWYQAVRPALGWDAAAAAARGEQLTEALQERDYLADLASRPLLLTLMATLHSSWGQLPEDRADLYEESVKLLLSRWQRGRLVREGQQTMIEPGIAAALGWGETRIRAALEKLAFVSHQRQGSEAERKDAPADIPQAEVLAAFAGVPENVNPRVVLSYLEQRAGLLVGRREEVYAFPHRSFQEYLAACHINADPESAARLRDLVRADPAWWREVFLLGVGKKRLGSLGDAVNAVGTLLPRDVAKRPTPTETDWRAAVLAGKAALELRLTERGAGQEHCEALVERVRDWLAALLERGQLPPKERWEAGDVLGALGDPRPGVGLRSLPARVGADPDIKVPDIVWCGIPAGPFLMGSVGDEPETYAAEKPQHTLDLPSFYLSRYLITNAQFQPFVASGGYANPAYWTPEGWAWRQGAEADLTPLESMNADFLRRYREWLAERPAEKRNQPYYWDHAQLGLPNRPVVGITWYETAAYCRWLTEQLGVSGSELRVWESQKLTTRHASLGTFKVQLPSEAEWEKAARGADGRRYPWGAQWREDCANTEEAELGQTSAVGLFPAGASPYGCLDMEGNVWEWTRSRWGWDVMRPDFSYPYVADDGREEESGAAVPILRGGSWVSLVRGARCASRHRLAPANFNGSIGFRVVLSLGDSGS
ncbi:MAG: SUMF1/EgtB/PvdO family nonheme iron enzyme [Anaerolineae bacterium]|jgi:formylglycine-generating enzyme required for sulfatase activity|nr:SUMF1/EgtB/PvdO family nonheme iron enzyme [Anaerolineae bacterium]